MKAKSRGDRLFRICGLLLLALSFILGWLYLDYSSFIKRSFNLDADYQDFRIPQGAGLSRIGHNLQRAGIIDSPKYFIIYARLNGYENKLQAGAYRIRYDYTPLNLITMFTEGRVIQQQITIIEGWNFSTLLQALHQHPGIKHLLADQSTAAILKQLDIAEPHPEGLFFPDTYLFADGTSDVKILRTAYREMYALTQEEWQRRAPDLPYNDPYDALIMASIIEKETADPSERDKISSVFLQRLKKGMRLQTDPTVIYGMGDDFDGNIRRRDLRRPGPYNTYLNKGLPPTPISLPGRASIHAALHPADETYLYFVAKGDGSGSHYFSTTLAEHNAAVKKYQLRR